jgi:hypothetical protein
MPWRSPLTRPMPVKINWPNGPWRDDPGWFKLEFLGLYVGEAGAE